MFVLYYRFLGFPPAHNIIVRGEMEGCTFARDPVKCGKGTKGIYSCHLCSRDPGVLKQEQGATKPGLSSHIHQPFPSVTSHRNYALQVTA
jgi:hypothetical protein